jgi:hypothetical protein
LIQKWGGIIQQDFVTRLAISCRHAEGELDTPVAPLHSGMSNVEGMMKQMLDNQNRILDENVALRAQVQLLSIEIVYLRKGLQYSNQRLQSIDNGNLRLSSILKSPDKVVSSSAVESPPSFPSFDKPDDEASEEGLKPSAHPVALMKQTSSLSDSATLPLLHTHPKPIVNISRWNYHAQSKCDTKKNDAKSKVSDLLLTRREKGSINAKRIASATLPDWICASGNKCYYRYCLEFIQFISATNETLALCIAKIADNTTDDTAALTAAEEIAKACFDTLKALDGKQVRKYTIIALGTRVRDLGCKLRSDYRVIPLRTVNYGQFSRNALLPLLSFRKIA